MDYGEQLISKYADVVCQIGRLFRQGIFVLT